MIPGNYNIEAYRNDTLIKTFTITENSVPVDLSTAVVKIQVREKPDAPVLFEFTEGNGLTVGGVGNNVISMSKVVDLSMCGRYYYDLQATFTSGIVSTYLLGTFIVKKDITI